MIPVSPAIGGLGLRSLELDQGLEQLNLLTALWSADTSSKSLLTSSLELLQLEAGSSKFILHPSFNTCAHLTTKFWFTSLWEFYSMCKLLPHLPHFTMPQAAVPSNISIIDTAIRSRCFSVEQLQQLKLVRIHFQVYFLSDLVRPGSTRALDCCMDGEEDTWTYSSYAWPRVVSSVAVRAVWKKCIRVITSGDQLLLCSLPHLRFQSCHQSSRCLINSSRTLLISLGSKMHSFFKLRPATRGDFHFVPSNAATDSTFEPIWVKSHSAKLRLHSPTFSACENSPDLSQDSWISNNVA